MTRTRCVCPSRFCLVTPDRPPHPIAFPFITTPNTPRLLFSFGCCVLHCYTHVCGHYRCRLVYAGWLRCVVLPLPALGSPFWLRTVLPVHLRGLRCAVPWTNVARSRFTLPRFTYGYRRCRFITTPHLPRWVLVLPTGYTGSVGCLFATFTVCWFTFVRTTRLPPSHVHLLRTPFYRLPPFLFVVAANLLRTRCGVGLFAVLNATLPTLTTFRHTLLHRWLFQ